MRVGFISLCFWDASGTYREYSSEEKGSGKWERYIAHNCAIKQLLPIFRKQRLVPHSVGCDPQIVPIFGG
jgi:hypothetical protein